MVVVLEGAAATHGDEPRIANLGEDHRSARGCDFISVSAEVRISRERSSCPSWPDSDCPCCRLLVRLIDAEDVPEWVSEGEPPSARILVQLGLDAASRVQHVRQRVIDVLGPHQRQDPLAAGHRRVRRQSTELVAGILGILDTRVVRSVIVERPPQGLRIEGLRTLEIVDREFDVVDHVCHPPRVTRRMLLDRDPSHTDPTRSFWRKRRGRTKEATASWTTSIPTRRRVAPGASSASPPTTAGGSISDAARNAGM